MNKAQITIVITTLGVLTTLGFNFTPVFKDEFIALAADVKSNKRRLDLAELYEKRVQLAKLTQEIEDNTSPPQTLVELKQYLEDEIQRLTDD